MKIKFGPAGLGGVKDAERVLEEYAGLGFKACEIAFTYGAYIKDEKTAKRIGGVAKKFGIQLSIHAHYWINLNSAEEEKVEASKQRILQCLKVGTWLGATKVVFHPGYYGKRTKEETYENIKNAILDLQKTRKEKGYTPKLAPETTGKVNVFGGLREIKHLVSDTGCSFTIDFAHILARNKAYRFDEAFELFKDSKEMHIHFSGIEYGDKGEKRHINTSKKEWRKLLENLSKLKGKEITIICESPSPVEDSLDGILVLREIETK